MIFPNMCRFWNFVAKSVYLFTFCRQMSKQLNRIVPIVSICFLAAISNSRNKQWITFHSYRSFTLSGNWRSHIWGFLYFGISIAVLREDNLIMQINPIRAKNFHWQMSQSTTLKLDTRVSQSYFDIHILRKIILNHNHNLLWNDDIQKGSTVFNSGI